MTHTPGPWTYEIGRGCKTISGRYHEIADTVGLDNELGGQDEANARLIAAAPELLEALKAILDIDNPPWGHPGHIDFNEGIEKAREAIAKAEGDA